MFNSYVKLPEGNPDVSQYTIQYSDVQCSSVHQCSHHIYCYVVLCCVLLRCAVLCCALLCSALLCYVMSWYVVMVKYDSEVFLLYYHECIYYQCYLTISSLIFIDIVFEITIMIHEYPKKLHRGNSAGKLHSLCHLQPKRCGAAAVVLALEGKGLGRAWWKVYLLLN